MATGRDKFRPRPRVALALSGIIVGLAVEDQITSGSVDPELVAALTFLVAFWAGEGVSRWFG